MRPKRRPRAKLRDAGYSHVQTTAALLEVDGDGDKALDLLKSGWEPPPPETLELLPPTPRGARGGAGASRCPFGFGGSSTASDKPPPPPGAGVEEAKGPSEADANAIRTLAERGMERAMIATILLVSVVYILPLSVAISLDHVNLGKWTDGHFTKVAQEHVGDWLSAWISLGGALSASRSESRLERLGLADVARSGRH